MSLLKHGCGTRTDTRQVDDGRSQSVKPGLDRYRIIE
jgi:hypothetical protein